MKASRGGLAVAAGVVTIIAACSDGDGASCEDWAAEVCQIAEDMQREALENYELFAENLPRAVSVGEERRVYIAWLDWAGGSAERMAQDLSAVPYPPRAETYHQALVREPRFFLTQIARARVRAEQAETRQDLENTFKALFESVETTDEATSEASEDLPIEARVALNRYKGECGWLFR